MLEKIDIFFSIFPNKNLELGQEKQLFGKKTCYISWIRRQIWKNLAKEKSLLRGVFIVQLASFMQKNLNVEWMIFLPILIMGGK